MNSDQLTHHGILGQRWGIRRFQNPDGSLTEAGRRRAQKLKGEYRELTGKKIKGKIPQSKEDPNKKSIRQLSDTELTDRIKRLRNEKEAHQLEKDLSGKGSKFVRSVGKDVLAPAAIEAGKNLMSKLFYKYGSQALGLSEKETKDGFKELKKATETAELKNRKYKAEQELKNRMEKEKQNQNEKKKSEPEFVKAEYVNTQSYKENADKGKRIFEAEYKEMNPNSTALTVYKKKGQTWFNTMYND